MPSERSKACAYAALQALGYYAAIYFVSLHFLVAWKWNTTGPDLDQLVVEIVNPLPHEVLGITNSNKNLSGVPTPETVDELLQDIQQARTPTTNSKEAQALLDDFHETLAKWKKADSAGASFLPEGSQSDQELELSNLLQQTSLAEMKDSHQVTSRMKTIVEELERLVDQKGGVRWSDIQDLLSPEEEFPSKEKLSADELEDMLCLLPVPPEDEAALEDETNSDPMTAESGDGHLQLQNISLYATEDDLEVHFSIIESVLDHRLTNPLERLQNTPEVSAQLEKCRKTLLEAMVNANGIVDNTVEEVSEARAKSSSVARQAREKASAGCNTVHSDDVMDLVNAGLNALARHQDLRTELLRVLNELDAASAENLILDAVFKTEPAIPSLPFPRELMVQRLVDTPLLPNLGMWLDRLLDFIGGYNDSLDHYVDQLQERLVDIHNKDASSLGKVFASTLLVRSGHLRIPIPEPVQKILQQTSGGRAVLASIS